MIPLLPSFAALFGLGGAELMIILLMLGVVPVFMGFWIWMIVDCVTHEKDSEQKIPWLLVICLTHFLGALIYFFARKLDRDKRTTPPLAPPPIGVPR